VSIQQLKAEAGALSDQERRELIGYLLSLGRQRSADYWDRLASKIADSTPTHWVAEEGLDQALGLDHLEK
jgi:hypothetical protein